MPETASPATSRLRGVMPWLREIVVIVAVYAVYSFVRNQFGSANLKIGDRPVHAFNNAVDIIHLEKTIGLFHEQTIQNWFLGTTWIIEFFNIFYGTFHFVVTIAVLVWIFVRKRQSFHRWRTTLMATTVFALIGFALFPLMPPRLFNTVPQNGEGRYGGGQLAIETGQPDYGFVDTLRTVGGLWSFDSKKLDAVSNQYAAMPSLHIAWSTWCTLVLLTFTRRKWAKALAIAYPILTLTVIVATANHYIIDAAGGLVILAAGYATAIGLERLTSARQGRSGQPAAEPAPTAVDDAAGSADDAADPSPDASSVSSAL